MQVLDTIIQGDCIQSLKKISDKSVDLIFADPPYNLQLQGELIRDNGTMVDAVNDERDKFASFEEYDEFTKEWLVECMRVLKDDGTIWVIGSYHNIFRVGKIMQDLGYWILNDILWIKSNPMPNFKGTRYTNAHETLIWASKGQGKKYTFHYHDMKKFNGGKQMRSDWYIPICSGGERLKDENGRKVHSTQKPEELLYRIIYSSSNVGDVVLDPFMGSGTTGAVAKLLKRHYIGLERDEIYIKYATERIKKVVPLEDKELEYEKAVKKPKVPFIELIEEGYIGVGGVLYNKSGDVSAIVKESGNLEYNGVEGSIHKISATALGKSNHNGRDYRYIKKGDKYIAINYIRYKHVGREKELEK